MAIDKSRSSVATAHLPFKAGVNTQASKLANASGWSASNLIRFKDGFAQKLGGCSHLSSTPIIGTARTLQVWQDLSGNDYAAIGTNQRLQLYLAGAITDITPIRKTSTLTSAFATTSGSTTVTITDALHGAAINDWVNITSAVYVGGGGATYFNGAWTTSGYIGCYAEVLE